MQCAAFKIQAHGKHYYINWSGPTELPNVKNETFDFFFKYKYTRFQVIHFFKAMNKMFKKLQDNRFQANENSSTTITAWTTTAT
jgi:hypothetical protein